MTSLRADASAPGGGGGGGGGAAVVAVQAFSADGPNELSCSQGERLTVINDDDPVWLYCSKALGKVIGFVPRACVRDVAAHVSIEVQAEVRARLPPGFQRSRWIHGKMEVIFSICFCLVFPGGGRICVPQRVAVVALQCFRNSGSEADL